MSRPQVSSFDVFDTLITRRVLDPTDVFDIVRERQTLPADFKQQRTASPGDFAAIYAHLQAVYGWSDAQRDAVAAEELQVERDVSIPIAENIALVAAGDIVVSDMYLPAEFIAELLKRAGLAVEVTVVVTLDGKGTGAVWERLLRDNEITDHLGDQPEKDLVTPQRYGIMTHATVLHQVTETEAFLFSQPGWAEHAHAIRQTRLANPYPTSSREYTLWECQATFFLPLALHICARVDARMQRDGHGAERRPMSRVLFVTRDGTLLQPLFEALYAPQRGYVVGTLWSSRRLHTAPTPDYEAYLRERFIPGTTLLVDMNGGFCSGQSLYTRLFGRGPDAVIGVRPEGTPVHAGVEAVVEVDGYEVSRIEDMASDYVGSVTRVERRPCGGATGAGTFVAVRDPPENDVTVRTPLHACMRYATSIMPPAPVSTNANRAAEDAFWKARWASAPEMYCVGQFIRKS